jgi:hypothetical protein
VADREGRLGWGSSARFELSAKLVAMLKEGKELADVIDEVSGKSDVRSNEGAMGIVTNGYLSVHPPTYNTLPQAPSHIPPTTGREPRPTRTGSGLRSLPSSHRSSTGNERILRIL